MKYYSLLVGLLLGATNLQAQTPATLQSEINTLKAQLVISHATNLAQIAQIAALQRQVNLIASNPALQLGPFVQVDPNPENGVTGPNIVFSGANVHIVSGGGAGVVDQTGKGNLIIGYDLPP